MNIPILFSSKKISIKLPITAPRVDPTNLHKLQDKVSSHSSTAYQKPQYLWLRDPPMSWLSITKAIVMQIHIPFGILVASHGIYITRNQSVTSRLSCTYSILRGYQNGETSQCHCNTYSKRCLNPRLCPPRLEQLLRSLLLACRESLSQPIFFLQ